MHWKTKNLFDFFTDILFCGRLEPNPYYLQDMPVATFREESFMSKYLIKTQTNKKNPSMRGKEKSLKNKTVPRANT